MRDTSYSPLQRHYMDEALFEADQAGLIGEVPIGAVIVHEGKIVGRGHNLREHANDATLHAEIRAIEEACATLKSWRLEDCQLYVSIEPCLMCSGAIINARIPEVYYGARDPKAGAVDSLYQTLTDARLNHTVTVHEGLMAKDAGERMVAFFKAARKRQKADKKARKAKAAAQDSQN
ncbi:nucleoside deaminase [Levilactobacillus parabrevis]|uniref:nucleoside deaminase n=1 Tax=Levilactobacillus parabrevis TaxID=357278 RepID=UPI0021A577E6|nr:nucleoside deaminase [Levilactobacillus parabrevis]MCT4487621.1 nucleoside deaminase [Levilactobacillus parabrevis]MCT4489726.1 nucleoside deaminase [Levilactobacillus parabrevis]